MLIFDFLYCKFFVFFLLCGGWYKSFIPFLFFLCVYAHVCSVVPLASLNLIFVFKKKKTILYSFFNYFAFLIKFSFWVFRLVMHHEFIPDSRCTCYVMSLPHSLREINNILLHVLIKIERIVF